MSCSTLDIFFRTHISLSSLTSFIWCCHSEEWIIKFLNFFSLHNFFIIFYIVLNSFYEEKNFKLIWKFSVPMRKSQNQQVATLRKFTIKYQILFLHFTSSFHLVLMAANDDHFFPHTKESRATYNNDEENRKKSATRLRRIRDVTRSIMIFDEFQLLIYCDSRGKHLFAFN